MDVRRTIGKRVHVARTYLQLTKPRIWGLLTFTSLATMILAAAQLRVEVYLAMLSLGMISISLASAGCEAVTGYLERDIDARMTRTKRRPVPSGRISPPEKALYFGVLLIATSLGLAAAINLASLTLISLGIINNILIYSVLSKRTTRLNIVFGSFGGAAPALFGWATVAGELSLPVILLALLVMAWTPWHIWTLAYCYRDDYNTVGVPMLSAVTSEKTAVRLIVSAALVLVTFSVAISYLSYFGTAYRIVSILTAAAVLASSFQLLRQGRVSDAWRMFKFSGPYLLLIFVAIIVDSLSGFSLLV